MANTVTDHLNEGFGVMNNNNQQSPHQTAGLKCRHCGGLITEGYAFNVHPDAKFHPNCLKCS